jgi:hypothetical protein
VGEERERLRRMRFILRIGACNEGDLVSSKPAGQTGRPETQGIIQRQFGCRIPSSTGKISLYSVKAFD